MTPEMLWQAQYDAEYAGGMVIQNYPTCRYPTSAHPQEPPLIVAGLALRLCEHVQVLLREVVRLQAAVADWQLIDERAKLNEARESLPPEGAI